MGLHFQMLICSSWVELWKLLFLPSLARFVWRALFEHNWRRKICLLHAEPHCCFAVSLSFYFVSQFWTGSPHILVICVHCLHPLITSFFGVSRCETEQLCTELFHVVNVQTKGWSEAAPTSAQVGCSLHRMGCVSSSGSWPCINPTLYQSTYLGCWPLTLFIFWVFFFNPDFITLQSNHPNSLVTLLT